MKPQLIPYSIILLAGLFISLFTACTPAYIPNAIHTPLFKQKGEIHGQVGTGTCGYDFQGAYAVTDNIGVMLNASIANRTSDSTNNYHKHAFVEMAGGYYYPIDQNATVEIYGGYGIGAVDAYYENSLLVSSARAYHHRVFIQPAIGVSTKIFDASFTPRIVLLNVTMVDPDLASSNTRSFYPYVEPCLTTRVGYKYVKYFFQIGLSINITNDYRNFSHQPLILNTGVQLSLFRDYDKVSTSSIAD